MIARRRWCAWACAPVLAAASRRVQAAPPLLTRWEDLVPREWDPTRRFRQMDLSRMNDADPKVLQLMRELRETWDNAPTDRRLDGTSVRLPGYVVPLETTAQGDLREFLLVPYFGACIHTPPPPANQIVHVVPDVPRPALRTMDTVWVSGVLRTRRQDTAMGMSGYAIRGASIERYLAPQRP